MNITLDEIKSKAPQGATHYVNHKNKVFYLKKSQGKWLVNFNYDCHSGWSIARQDIEHIIKPL